jgi:hypothetical protein
MKTNIIDAIALIASATALLLLILTPDLVVSIVVGTGIISVFCSDFAKPIGEVQVPATIVPFCSARQSPTETREAA